MVCRNIKEDPSHHLNQFKRENDNISMGDEKVRQNLKDDSSHLFNQLNRENEMISLEDLKHSIT